MEWGQVSFESAEHRVHNLFVSMHHGDDQYLDFIFVMVRSLCIHKLSTYKIEINSIPAP